MELCWEAPSFNGKFKSERKSRLAELPYCNKFAPHLEHKNRFVKPRSYSHKFAPHFENFKSLIGKTGLWTVEKPYCHKLSSTLWRLQVWAENSFLEPRSNSHKFAPHFESFKSERKNRLVESRSYCHKFAPHLTVTHAAPNHVIFYAAISNFLVLSLRAE